MQPRLLSRPNQQQKGRAVTLNLDTLIQKWLEKNTVIDEVENWFNSMPIVNKILNDITDFLGIENWIADVLTPIITAFTILVGVALLALTIYYIKIYFRD